MKYFFSIFGIFLCSFAALAADNGTVISLPSGECLSGGSGYFNTSGFDDTYFPALVNNSGDTVFLAPKIGSEGSTTLNIDTFLYNYQSTDAQSTDALYPFKTQISLLPETNFSLGGDAALEYLWCLSKDYDSENSSTFTINLKTNSSPYSENYSTLDFSDNDEITLDSSFQFKLTSDGSEALIKSDSISLSIWEKSDNSITELNLDPEPDSSCFPAISGDGNILYYYTVEDSKILIYQYNRSEDKITYVESAGSDELDNIQLCTSDDGHTFLFLCNRVALLIPDESSISGTHIVIGKWDSTTNTFSYDIVSTYSNNDFDSIALSNNGRFAVFTAKINESSDFYQTYRYDIKEASYTPECISKNDSSDYADADCYVPAISPNGRFVTFVSAAKNFTTENTTDYNQVWLVDNGPYFTIEDMQAEINNTTGTILELDTCSSILSDTNATITISLTADSCTKENTGYFIDKDGNEMDYGAAYSTETLPWSFISGEESTAGTYDCFKVEIAENGLSYANDLAITIIEKTSYLGISLDDETGLLSTTDHPYTYLHCNNNGNKLIFATDAKLSSSDDNEYSDIYLAEIDSSNSVSISRLSKYLTGVTNCAISGDGENFVWVYNDTTGNHLEYQNSDGTIQKITDPNHDVSDQLSPAFSHDGSILAAFSIELSNDQDTISISIFKKSDEGQYTLPRTLELSSTSLIETSNSPKLFLSYTGDTLVYFYKNELFRCYPINTTDDETVTATQIVLNSETTISDLISLNSSGTQCVILDSDNVLQQINTADGSFSTNKTFPLLNDSTIFNHTCSQNSRMLFYLINDDDDNPQLYNFDLSEQTEQAVTTQTGSYCYANTTDGKPAISANGKYAFFVSTDTTLTPGATSDVYNIYRYEIENLHNTTPEIIQPTAEVLEDSISNAIPLTYQDAEKDDVLIKIASQPQNGTISSLLPFYNENTGYTILYTPNSDFCEEDSFTVQLNDGNGWGEAQTVTISVTNVNDAPTGWKETTQTTLSVDENAKSTTSYAGFVNDIDLNNNQDTITFSLVESETKPSWASITPDGVLTLQPDNNTVVHNVGTTVFSFLIKATDIGGESIFQNITITVHDVDQMPTIEKSTLCPEFITENDTIYSNWFVCTDDDEEDKNKLKLTFESASSSFNSKELSYYDGETINTNGITYTPATASLNQDTVTVSCSDGINTSEESVQLTIQLKNTNIESSLFWTLTNDSESTEISNKTTLKANSWNLLSVPINFKTSQLVSLGQKIYYWDSCGRYCQRELTPEDESTLNAGDGFWLYIDDLPSELPSITGTQEFFDSLSSTDLSNGWHLRGPLYSKNLDTSLWYKDHDGNNIPCHFYQNQTFSKQSANYSPAMGTASWIWINNN